MYEVHVLSEEFRGVRTVMQHRMVNEVYWVDGFNNNQQSSVDVWCVLFVAVCKECKLPMMYLGCIHCSHYPMELGPQI